MPSIEALSGPRVSLRPAAEHDIEAIVAIRSQESVHSWWQGDDLVGEFHDDLAAPDLHLFVIEVDGIIVGGVQWSANDDPQYRHASIDVYVHHSYHRRGYGSDAVRTLARHLIDEHGYQRFVVDPAASNENAIACYTSVGFRPVGIMRRYERTAAGTWRDGLLMDLLSDELER